MRDTSAEAAAVQIAAFRRLSPAERVGVAFEASEWIMTVARARPLAVLPVPTPAVGSEGAPSLAVPEPRVR